MNGLAEAFDVWDLRPKRLDAGGRRSSGWLGASTSPSESPELRKEFDELAAVWRAETLRVSSIAKEVVHSAYQKIIGMGPVAVPWVLEEMQARPNHWAWALRAMTRDDPVASEDAGRLDRIVSSWLRWACEHDVAVPDRGSS